jgi:hypothetical protein
MVVPALLMFLPESSQRGNIKIISDQPGGKNRVMRILEQITPYPVFHWDAEALLFAMRYSWRQAVFHCGLQQPFGRESVQLHIRR